MSAAADALARARGLVDRRLWVRLRDGREVVGLLQCFDKQGNLILGNAVETSPNGPETNADRKVREHTLYAAGVRRRHAGTVMIPPHFRIACFAEVPAEDGGESQAAASLRGLAL